MAVFDRIELIVCGVYANATRKINTYNTAGTYTLSCALSASRARAHARRSIFSVGKAAKRDVANHSPVCVMS